MARLLLSEEELRDLSDPLGLEWETDEIAGMLAAIEAECKVTR